MKTEDLRRAEEVGRSDAVGYGYGCRGRLGALEVAARPVRERFCCDRGGVSRGATCDRRAPRKTVDVQTVRAGRRGQPPPANAAVMTWPYDGRGGQDGQKDGVGRNIHACVSAGVLDVVRVTTQCPGLAKRVLGFATPKIEKTYPNKAIQIKY
ncbi:hypothetical protein EJ06DRAFT_390907 [Trichodelitschia bisporula]|uniref:Uncharacterized protein n=1 Tax=Trichodelitschia bisporula TaxID=703511 RepID=A0A6G1I097_9PEZI|nr:hypothetical protein EJ06DRAFT_390907 [Trichodelitschia bisporula]